MLQLSTSLLFLCPFGILLPSLLFSCCPLGSMPATSKSPYEYTQMMKSDNDAPEVALQNYPIPALEDSDGLQSNPNGYAPYVADRAAAYNAAHDPVDAPKDVTQKQRSRRPSWLWLLLGAVIAAAIGLGAGVGIGYGVGTTKTNAKWERNGYGDGSAYGHMHCNVLLRMQYIP